MTILVKSSTPTSDQPSKSGPIEPVSELAISSAESGGPKGSILMEAERADCPASGDFQPPLAGSLWPFKSLRPRLTGFLRPGKFRLIKWASGLVLGLVALFFLALALVEPPDPRDFSVSPVVLDRNGALLFAALSSDDEWLLAAPLSQMGDWIPKLTVAIEDKRFYRHLGVDPLAVMRAVGQNISSFKVISGASTITVQLVRLSRPRPRTFVSKAVEFLEALKLETMFSKEEILELYLNRAPFGGNVRGVRAAAAVYFNKTPQELSLGESATLVALLRGPSIYRPDRRTQQATERRNYILDLLVKKNVITASEVEAARMEVLQAVRHSLPGIAPHASRRLIASFGPERYRWQSFEAGAIRATLSEELQERTQRRLVEALKPFPLEVDGAGILLDNKTGQILAYVGSARAAGPSEYVDLAASRRSSGSTLKPFVYLEAFSSQAIGPASMLADTPLLMAGEAPRNFDRSYRGPVSAGRALADSLNAPAVRVLRMVGEPRAIKVLNAAGLTIGSERVYGDSLVLGGAETTVIELAGAYASLANGGVLVRPRLTFEDRNRRDPAGSSEAEMTSQTTSLKACAAGSNCDDLGTEITAHGPAALSGQTNYGPAAIKSQAAFITPSAKPSADLIFDPAAVWLVNESLKDSTRLPVGLRGDSLAFKTGTSHGLRDAWFAAYNPAYTLVVWLGDSTGKAHEGLSGLNALAPAAVGLMRSLEAAPAWPEPPETLERYRACPITGEPVSPICPSFKWAWRMAWKAKTHPCRLHVLRDGQVVNNWPPELAEFVGEADWARSFVNRPSVVSPRNGEVIRLLAGVNRFPLRSEGTSGSVHWYVDDAYLTQSGPGHTPVLTLTEGEHWVSLVDGRGLTAKSRFTVIGAPVETAEVLTVRRN
ncbi:MAG: transglycosylase domain-containing protein [Deltaproteobacteria bacterium]|jgi:penicillin-binding protein 1C|nr:transglycosylase domain-containing protein [Deltaproteobacteria bacterium]